MWNIGASFHNITLSWKDRTDRKSRNITITLGTLHPYIMWELQNNHSTFPLFSTQLLHGNRLSTSVRVTFHVGKECKWDVLRCREPQLLRVLYFLHDVSIKLWWSLAVGGEFHKTQERFCQIFHSATTSEHDHPFLLDKTNYHWMFSSWQTFDICIRWHL